MQRKSGDDRPVPGDVLKDLLKATIERGASFSFRARGSSMSPLIRDGDMVTVSPLSSPSAKIGDVLAYTCPLTGRLVVHRMVGRKDGSFIMKADNSPEPKEIVPHGNVLGWVTKMERRGKRILFGLGPERFVIGLFSRAGFLYVLLSLLRYIRSLGKPARRY